MRDSVDGGVEFDDCMLASEEAQMTAQSTRRFGRRTPALPGSPMALDRRTFIQATFLATLAVPALSSCGTQSNTGNRQAIKYAQKQPIQGADPAHSMIVYPAPDELCFVIYDRLVALDESLNIRPQLAKTWQVSDDQRTWTFNLRQDATLHDGTPLDAQVVVDDARRKANPTNPQVEWTTKYSDFRVKDKYTVEFVTKEPWGPILYYLANQTGGIVSPSAAKSAGSDRFATDPVGSGPYEVTEFVPGSYVQLTPFGGYRGPKPGLTSMRFQYAPEDQTRITQLQTGEADIIADVLPHQAKTIDESPDTQLLRTLGARPFWIQFNLTNPIFNDVRVRRALNHAVDKRAITDKILLGYAKPSNSPVSSVLTAYREVGEYTYDPDRATQMLAAAGWRPGSDGILAKDGEKLSFNIMNGKGQYPQGDRVVQAVQANLNAIGCKVSIKEVPAPSFYDLLKVPLHDASYDSVFFGFNPSTGEAGYLLEAMFHSNPDPKKTPPQWNYMGYTDDKVDSLLERAAQRTDENERNDLYADAQELIWNDAPAIWLYVPEVLAGARRNVDGVFIWPTIFTSLRGADLK